MGVRWTQRTRRDAYLAFTSTSLTLPLFLLFVLQILDMYESQDVVKSNATGAQANNADDDWEL